MTSEQDTGIERSIRRYPVYLFFQKASYWGPVFFLYFNSLLSLADVLLLEAIYYIGVVVLEVPTGYLADRIGPRRILIASSLAQMLACAAFISSGHFAVLAAGQVLLGLGMSLGSGSDTSYHYALVKSLHREADFGHRESRAARAILLSQGTAALVGGMVASVDLRYAYALTIISSGIAALLAFRFVEVDETGSERESIGRQLLSCLKDARHPRLMWLLGFYVYMTVVNHIPHEFYQPFIGMLIQTAELDWSPAGVSGVHTALTMAVASVGAAWSVRLSDRLGPSGALLVAAGVQTLIIGSMALTHTPAVALLILLRSVPRGLMYAPLNATIVPLVGAGRRATYLSLQSLFGRLAFGATLLAFSVSFPEGSIEGPLSVAAIGAVAGLIVLFLTGMFFRTPVVPSEGTERDSK